MTIKETAGKVLLYFYQLQRAAPLSMPRHQVGFIDRKDKGVGLTSDKRWLSKDLQDINPTGTDVLNAFMFLLNKDFIESRGRVTPEARIYVGIQLTANGIDIVEGVERGREGRREFEATFNIRVEDDISVDNLMRENLKNLSE